MKQTRFVPSGCQFWNHNIISSSSENFAYCSTIGIYIHNFSNNFQCSKLFALKSAENSLIRLSYLCFHPHNSNLLACLSSDSAFNIWDVEREKIIMTENFVGRVHFLEWSPFETDRILLVIEDEIKIFDITTKKLEKILQSDSPIKCIEWNTKIPSTLLYGRMDGSIIIYNTSKKKSIKIAKKDKPTAQFVKWDLLSQNYFIAVWLDGNFSLFDSESEKEMQIFDKQNAGISSLVWIKSVPGGFLTCNEKIAAIKLWTVSNRSPHKTFKAGLCGIIKMITIPSENQYIKEGLLLSFKNSSIGIFDFSKKRLDFVTEPSHSETIFDLKFSNINKNILASGSYDGSVKIWDINKMTCLSTLMNSNTEKKLNPLYGLSWSPKNNEIVTVHSNGEMALWDCDKNKLLSLVKPGKGLAIYRVEWNKIKTDLIASGSTENFAFIYKVENQKLSVTMRIPHSSAVYGVSWNKGDGNILATASHDCLIRVFNISQKDGGLPLVFKGHTSKPFNVEWNPILFNYFASGSDDTTIRVWNIQNLNDFKELVGHTNNVRGLLWNTEIPWLLLSGSWDSTIRLWDVRTKNCIFVCKDHNADVYGIAVHEDRPFTYVSCSRDTSLRFWNLEDMFNEIFLRVLENQDDCFGEEIEVFPVEKEIVRLFGSSGRKMKKDLKVLWEGEDMIGYYERILNFFKFNEGEEEFWDTVRNLKGKIKVGARGNNNNSIVSMDELYSVYYTKAQVLEIGSKGFSYDTMNKKADKLSEAAKIYIKIGQFERFCECLIKNDEWEKALAYAPSVSYDYWKSIALRYADYLVEQDDMQAANYYQLSGEISKSLDFLLKKQCFQDGELLANYALSNKMREPPKVLKTSVIKDQKNENSLVSQNLLKEITEQLADVHLRQGKGVHSSTLHLSIKDIEGCAIKLIRTNELCYAYVLSQLFQLSCHDIIIKKMAEKAIFVNDFQLGRIFLEKMKKNLDQKSILMRNLGSRLSEMPLGIKKLEEYANLGKSMLDKFDFLGAVVNNILAKNYHTSFEIAVDYAKNILSAKKYQKYQELFNLFDMLPYESLKEITNLQLKNHIIAINYYFALKKSIWKGLQAVFTPLYKALRKLMKNQAEFYKDFPISIVKLEVEYYLAVAPLYPSAFSRKIPKLINKITDQNLKKTFGKILKTVTSSVRENSKIQKNFSRNSFHLLSTTLPKNFNQAEISKSIFSNTNITESEIFLLEDRKSAINYEEAITWSDVSKLSSLGTGFTINV